MTTTLMFGQQQQQHHQIQNQKQRHSDPNQNHHSTSTAPLSPRDRMVQAKAQIMAAGKDDSDRFTPSRKLSYASSLESEVAECDAGSSCGSSRSASLRSNPPSILRRPPPPSFQPPNSPERLQRPQSIPISPAPSLPLPPAPSPTPTSISMSASSSLNSTPRCTVIRQSLRILDLDTDFGPLLPAIEGVPSPSTSASASASAKLRRRSSRVRFSDQPHQPELQANLLTPVSRASSLKGLRRESSIDGLRADLAEASHSFNRKVSTISSGSLGRRISITSNGSSTYSYSRSSIASSTESDPFNWATSSYGSRPSLSLGLGEVDELEVDDGDGEGFSPQALPYPKIPPAHSRLSVETTASSIWSDGGNSISSSLPSPTLKQTLERASLGSSVHDVEINRNDSQESNAFSLEAKIRLSPDGSDSLSLGRSSYAPTASLRSSASEQELESISLSIASTNSSFSFHLPPRAQTIAYATLLPRRRSSLQAQRQANPGQGHVPPINRGEWYTDDLELSPLSVPVVLESSSGRGKTRLIKITSSSDIADVENTHEKRQSIEIELGDNPSTSLAEEPRARLDSIDSFLLPPAPSPTRVYTALVVEGCRAEREGEGNQQSRKNGHQRSESTFSAIMSFPIPPDRKVVESNLAALPKEDALDALMAAMGLESDEDDEDDEQEHELELEDQNSVDARYEADNTPMAVQTNVMPRSHPDHEDLDVEMPMTRKASILSPSPDFPDETPRPNVTGVLQDMPLPQAVEGTEGGVISLNSPFEIEQIATLAQAMQFVSPTLPSHDGIGSPLVEEVFQPSSPELNEVILHIPRPRYTRSASAGAALSTDMLDDTETEESDLDIASPLIKVAMKSRILTPRSRLLRPSSYRQTPSSPSPSIYPSHPGARARPGSSRTVSASSVPTLSSLKSGVGLTSGRGWSGSDSEEEEWVMAVREIASRRGLARRTSGERQSKGLSLSPPSFGQAETPELRAGKSYRTNLTIQVEQRMEEGSDDTPTAKTFTNSIIPDDAEITSGTLGKAKSTAMNRLSQLSEMSSLSTSTLDHESTPLTPLSLEMLTPAVAALTRTLSTSSSNSALSMSTGSSLPGRYPWGASSPPHSPIRGLFASSLSNGGVSPTKEVFITSFRNLTKSRNSSTVSSTSASTKTRQVSTTASTAGRRSSRADSRSESQNLSHTESQSQSQSRSTSSSRGRSRNLPTPTREVEGWGEPEILIDGDSAGYASAFGSESGDGDGSASDWEYPRGSSLRGSFSDLSLKSEMSMGMSMSMSTGGSMVDLRGQLEGEDEGELPTPRKADMNSRMVRAPSPDVWNDMNCGTGEEMDTSLMDEEMPI